MKQDKYDRANRIEGKKYKINLELAIWQNQLQRVSQLAWGSNNVGDSGYAQLLESNMSKGLFDGFRQAVINELKLRLLELSEEFEKL